MSAPAASSSSSSSSAVPHQKSGQKRKTHGERKQLAQVKRQKPRAPRKEGEEDAEEDAENENANTENKEDDSDSSMSDDSSDDDDDDDEAAAASADGAPAAKKKKGPAAPAAGSTSGHIKNVPMVLVTCDSGKEQLCKKEMMAWLIEYADRVYPRTNANAMSEDSTAASSSSVSGGLEAELAALKAEAAAERSAQSSSSSSSGVGPRFKIVGDLNMFRGIILIAIQDPAICPVRLIEGMLTEVRQTKIFRTRFTVHLHPFQQTCYSTMEDVFKLASTIVPAGFTSILTSTDPKIMARRKFSVEWVRRGNHTQMDRDKTIAQMASLVPKSTKPEEHFKVDLKKPEIVILVEVLGRLTGISVFTQFAEYSKFNLRTIFEEVMGIKQEAAKKDPADQAAAQKAANEKRKKHEERAKQEKAAKAAKLAAQEGTAAAPATTTTTANAAEEKKEEATNAAVPEAAASSSSIAAPASSSTTAATTDGVAPMHIEK